MSLVEKYFNTPIKHFQSDWGGEFQALRSQLLNNGIQQRVTCPYNPEQNGCAERKHHHIVETGLSLLNHSGVPKRYWPHAFETATYVINRLPSPTTLSVTPFSVLFQQPPAYDNLHSFGCLCYPWLRPYSPHKLAPRSSKCVFLGYGKLHKGYICLALWPIHSFQLSKKIHSFSFHYI